MPLPYMRAVCVAVAQHPYGSPGTMPMEASRAVVSGPYVDRSGSRYVNPSYASTTSLGRRGTGRGRPTAARRTSDSRPMPPALTGEGVAGKGVSGTLEHCCLRAVGIKILHDSDQLCTSQPNPNSSAVGGAGWRSEG